jgi:hypothetical protein
MSAALDDPEYYGHVEADPADRRLSVRFSKEAKLDHQKTEAEGREVYKEVEYIRILIPGDKTLSVFRPVQPSDKQRFPDQYRAFKAREGQAIQGTPLVGWPLITEAQRKELEYFNIYTVEQLAGVADGYVAGMMGVQALKQAASKFLETIDKNAPVVALQKELEKQGAQIASIIGEKSKSSK